MSVRKCFGSANKDRNKYLARQKITSHVTRASPRCRMGRHRNGVEHRQPTDADQVQAAAARLAAQHEDELQGSAHFTKL